jgi:hypothetical protein
MPLLSIWASNPETISEFSVEQVVSVAGDGKLLDGSDCSEELREYLSQIDSEKLSEYADHCLNTRFDNNGKILQDIVNEFGRRLDYDVANGRYQGSQNSVGNDGLWLSPEGHHLLVEVKTTDVYSISLDTIAKYRNSLRDQQKLNAENSMLLVVGRYDTGQLEAQVRGSRHAWDMRLISVDSLVSLVRLKESTEDETTSSKIRSILVPKEYTRLDNLIDIVFTAAQDVESSVEAESKDETETRITERRSYSADITEPTLLDQKRSAILKAVAEARGVKLVKKSRASYWSSDREFRVACSVSKRYAPPGDPYWFGYQEKWRDFIRQSKVGLFVLGCMDLDIAFAIPASVMETKLDDLGTTVRPKAKWWHIVVREAENCEYIMICSKTGNHLTLTPFVINLTE